MLEDKAVDLITIKDEPAEANPIPQILPGLMIAGKIRITRLLGRGGMGAVFEATDLILQRKVAIKFLLAAHDGADSLRFNREAQAATALSHINIACVREAGIDPFGRQYLVMDFVDGCPLSEIIKKQGPLSQARAIELAIQLGNGLSHAHQQKVLHRDIKPSNVMVQNIGEESEQIKIVDFGVAKMIREDLEESARLTLTGETIGTPYYMSPEQALGEHTDERTDIYSFGCVLYEMVTGEPPFAGENPLAIMTQHLHKQPSSITSPHVSPELNKLVLRCLEKQQTRRYQSFDQVVCDLKLILHGKNIAKPLFPRNRKRTLALAILIFTVAIGGGITAFALRNRSPNLYEQETKAFLDERRIDLAIGDGIALLNKAESEHAPASVIGRISAGVGSLYQKTKQYDEAKIYYFKALSFLDRQASGYGSSLYGLALSEFETRDVKVAMERAKEALGVYRRLRSPNNVAICLEQLGKIQYMMGDYEEALRSFTESRDLYAGQKRVQNIRVGMVSWLLCETCLACNKLPEAEEFYQLAITNCRNIRGEDPLIKKWRGQYAKLVQMPPPRLNSMLDSQHELNADESGNWRDRHDAKVFYTLSIYLKSAGKVQQSSDAGNRCLDLDPHYKTRFIQKPSISH